MRIKALREDNDLKQTDLADFLHIRQSTYSQYENEQRQIPLPILISLARFYRVSVDYLLELTDKKSPYPPKKE